MPRDNTPILGPKKAVASSQPLTMVEPHHRAASPQARLGSDGDNDSRGYQIILGSNEDRADNDKDHNTAVDKSKGAQDLAPWPVSGVGVD